MNPDDFEQALSRDMAAVPRHDPTPAWKAEILNHALAKPKARIITFPKLMLGAWAACWIVSAGLRLLTPSDEAPTQPADPSVTIASSPDADWRSLENRRDAMRALLASNDPINLPHP